MGTAIKALHLTKSYDEVIAIQDLNLSISSGAIFGFLGANGAGKSTTIDCLTGLSDPDDGEVYLLNERYRGEVGLKKRIGILPSNLALFEHLTATEFLIFQGRMFGLSREMAQMRTKDLLAALDLQEAPRKRLGQFSTGMRKKVAFAASVIHSPEILFLDEPFESVDPASTATMKSWLKSFADSGRTVFFSSHVLDVIENFCTHVGILLHGQLAWESEMNGKLRADGMEFQDLESLFLHVTGVREMEVSWI